MMKVSTRGILLITSLVASLAQASIPSHPPAKTYPNSVSLATTKSALMLPLTNRIEAVQAAGPEGYRNLVTIMFDEKQSMDLRWRATMSVGRIGGKLAEPELERALAAQEWFMRNAGLLALARVNQTKALELAEKLLGDKALVVRASAVDVINDYGDAKSTDLLWKKLYSKENYKGKQSLFIRRRIVETLAKVSQHGDEAKFVQVLGDGDESLHGPAIAGLEHITSQKLGGNNEPMKFKRAYWQKWWGDRTAL